MARGSAVRALALASVIVVAAPLHAGFNEIARAIDAQPGVERIGMPFMGLVRLIVWVSSPKGVHDFQMTTFEGAEHVDAAGLQRLMQKNAGNGFKPLVQARSRKSGEWSFIYAKAKPDSDRFELLILSHDRSDTVLLRCEVDAETIARQIEWSPRNVTEVARR